MSDHERAKVTCEDCLCPYAERYVELTGQVCGRDLPRTECNDTQALELRCYEMTIARLRAELQMMYAAFEGSGHSPHNPREAKQAIEQMREEEIEVEGLRGDLARKERVLEAWRRLAIQGKAGEVNEFDRYEQIDSAAIGEAIARGLLQLDATAT